MSGLFGYFGRASSPQQVVRDMGLRMRHHDRLRLEVLPTGPQGAIGRIGLGLITTPPQTACLPDGEVTLLLCGELYHQEQRCAALVRDGTLAATADDAALALHVYLREGAIGLAQLEGAFVAAVWDGRAEELTLVNDRFGLYPHFYAHGGGALSFAPEMKGVLCAPEVPRRLDMAAIAEYTRFQQLLGERTWLEDVHLLPPATILRYCVRQGRLTQTRYWDWNQIASLPQLSFDEAVEETIRLFQRAIDAMTRPPLRVGVYLSGGLDGRTILGFIDPATAATAITFGSAECRDVIYAAQIAQRANRPRRWIQFVDGSWVLEHFERHLALTEGQHSWMHSHGMSTLTEARGLIDVNISGWDGGTVMGGRLDEYATDGKYRHASDDTTQRDRLFDAFCRVFTWPGLTNAEAEQLFGCELDSLAHESFSAEWDRASHYPAPYRSDYFYILQHVRRSTQNMIVFQRSEIEVRCPFFDYGVVDFLYAMPERFKQSPDHYHAVITRRMPKLAMVPNEKTDELPHSSRLVHGAHRSLQRAKRAVNRLAGPVFPERPRLYADYEHYLRTDLRPWAESILFDQRTIDRGLFNPGMVRDLWELHLSGKKLWTIGKIAPLMSIELTLRLLFDDL